MVSGSSKSRRMRFYIAWQEGWSLCKCQLAQGKISLERVQIAFERQAKLPAGLAPAHGLTLVEVKYGSHELDYETE